MRKRDTVMKGEAREERREGECRAGGRGSEGSG